MSTERNVADPIFFDDRCDVFVIGMKVGEGMKTVFIEESKFKDLARSVVMARVLSVVNALQTECGQMGTFELYHMTAKEAEEAMQEGERVGSFVAKPKIHANTTTSSNDENTVVL